MLALCEAQWRPDRHERFSTFPLPVPSPVRLVGVNSVALSVIAGRAADGINVAWTSPRRDEYLDAAATAAGTRPFLRTVYTTFDPDLLDEHHPDRVAMAERGIDRLILSVFDLDLLL